ncbi:MAG: MFS transporter [Chloroflexi bacterium]|nr:MFS transporter [Chloroflexota bacterium]
MAEKSYQVYGYRWVVLGVFMLINVAIQILWICFAPITGPAAEFYGVSDLSIGFLAMSFMFVYIPISMPISWVIDTLGYYKSVSIGAGIMAIFALLRGVLAGNYTWVFISTLGLAVAQPFMMNAISTVAAKWFPMKERATVGGLATIASFLGIAIGEVASPALFLQYGIQNMLLIYGGVAAVSAILFVIFTREAPPTPPCPEGQETRALMMDGLKGMLKMKDMWILFALFLVGMGVFNGISTWIEGIVRSRGFTITQAGNLGGVLLLGGIIGAAIIPVLSDRLHKRKLFLVLGLILAIPGLIGTTYATSYVLMVASLFVLGFFLMSLAPVGYQYAAEITFPSPEGTSNGLLNLAGQLSVVFIYSMEAFKSADGSFTFSMLLMVAMMGMAALLVTRLNESTAGVDNTELAVEHVNV